MTAPHPLMPWALIQVEQLTARLPALNGLAREDVARVLMAEYAAGAAVALRLVQMIPPLAGPDMLNTWINHFDSLNRELLEAIDG